MGDEVRVGMTLSESGWAVTDTAMNESSVRFWVDDVNDRGGLWVADRGRSLPVRLVTRDDRSDPAHAARMYEEMIVDEGIDVAAAPATSDMTAAVLPVTERHRVVLANGMAPDDRLFHHGYRYTFLAGRPLSGVYAHYPAFLAARGVRLAANLYSSVQGFHVLSAPLSELMAEVGGEVVVERSFPPGPVDWPAVLADVAAAGAEAIFVSVPFPDETALLDAFPASGLRPACVVLTYAPYLAAQLDGVAGVFGWEYLDPTPPDRPVTVGYDRETYARRRRELTGEEGGEPGGTFLALSLWEHFVGRAGTLDPDAVMRAAHQASGDAVTAQGVFEIDETGCPPRRPCPVTQVQRGPDGALARVVVWPPELARAEAELGAFPAAG